MAEHRFGHDDWTESKLDALENYLKAYRLIFDRNEKARYYKTMYIDAFAGSGSRYQTQKESPNNQSGLFDDNDLAPTMGNDYRRGSARRALELESKFDQYIFVDKNPDHVADLNRMIESDFPSLADRCRVLNADGCDVMRELCTHGYGKSWDKWRAVVFLDPYGMNIEWDLLWRIAGTKAMDLWLLWPLGMGVNRLLKRDGKPNAKFATKLTRCFGTQDWEKTFYRAPATQDMFQDAPASDIKDTDWDIIGNFFLERLRTIFAGVAPRTKVLYNSCGNPMYLLCFAAGNPRGAKPAIDIADYLMQD